MRRLGYKRYVAQGGDWGAVVTTELARQQPAGLAGIHLNMPLVIPQPIPAENLTAQERRAVDLYQRFLTDGFGYFHLQATRPQTVGYALTDSPVGQAAWIYEKFQAWTDNRGDPEDALTRDEMLDTITLYWLTETAASSARIYLENASVTGAPPVITIPVGCSIFPRESVPAPRRWAERVYPNLIHWNELDRGGHARDGGDLRVAHFFATHAMHFIPAFGFIASLLLSANAARLAIIAFSALFTGLVGYAFVESLMGRPFLPTLL